MNESNLKPLSPEEARRRGRNGGLKSAEVRKERKIMKEQLQVLLEMTIKKGKRGDFSSIEESAGKNITVEQALLLAQINQALAGDTRAAEFIRDTSGNKPVQEASVSTTFNNGMLGDILDQLKDDKKEGE